MKKDNPLSAYTKAKEERSDKVAEAIRIIVRSSKSSSGFDKDSLVKSLQARREAAAKEEEARESE